MATFLNTIVGLYNQTQEYQIEGISYFLNTQWNPRNGWEVSIYDNSNTPLLIGLLAVPDQNITWRYSRGTGLFTGDLWVDDTSIGTEVGVITKDNFGQGRRYQLVYRTKAEMDAEGINPRSFNA